MQRTSPLSFTFLRVAKSFFQPPLNSSVVTHVQLISFPQTFHCGIVQESNFYRNQKLYYIHIGNRAKKYTESIIDDSELIKTWNNYLKMRANGKNNKRGEQISKYPVKQYLTNLQVKGSEMWHSCSVYFFLTFKCCFPFTFCHIY